MKRFRMTIRSAMALVLFAGVAFAALRDPSMWWTGAVLACLIGLLLTACIGAIYRTGRERAFWLGIVVFGGGYLLLAQILSSDGTGNPVAIINRVLDWADDSNVLLSPAQIPRRTNGDYSAVGNKLVMILVALIGSVVAVAFYDSRERRQGERPSQAGGGNRE
jgi:uncharacterized membrane protein